MWQFAELLNYQQPSALIDLTWIIHVITLEFAQKKKATQMCNLFSTTKQLPKQLYFANLCELTAPEISLITAIYMPLFNEPTLTELPSRFLLRTI